MTQTISLVLNEQMTPLATYESKVAEFENRLSKLESLVAQLSPVNLEAVRADLDTVVTEVDSLKQSAARVSEVDEVRTSLGTVEETVASVQSALGGFSFDAGNADAYAAAGTLDPRQLFVVVDTPERLRGLAENDTGTEPEVGFRLAMGWQ